MPRYRVAISVVGLLSAVGLLSCSTEHVTPQEPDLTHVGLYELREVGHVPLPSPIETMVNYKTTRDALSGQLRLQADGKYTLSIAWRWRDAKANEVERGVARYEGTYTRKNDSLFFTTTSPPEIYAPPVTARLIGTMLHGEAFSIVAEYERVARGQ